MTNSADLFPDKDLSYELSGNFPPKLFNALKGIWATDDPDCFYFAYQRGKCCGEQKSLYYYTSARGADYAVACTQTLPEMLVHDKHLKQMETIALHKMDIASYQNCYIISCKQSGLNSLVTACFSDDKKPSATLLRKLALTCMSFATECADSIGITISNGDVNLNAFPELSKAYAGSREHVSVRRSATCSKHLNPSGMNTVLNDILPSSALSDTENALGAGAETDMLQILGNQIAVSGNLSDLRDALSAKLHKIFKVSSYMVLVVNQDGHTWKYVLCETESEHLPDHFSKSDHPVHDGVFDNMLNSDRISGYDINQVHKLKSIPDYLAHWSAVGFDHAIAFPLKAGTENLGVLLLKPFSPMGLRNNQLQIGRDLAWQVAVSVSHLRASEQTQLEQEQNRILMGINTALATVSNTEELSDNIERLITSFLGYSQHCIMRINEDSSHVSPYLFTTNFPLNPDGLNSNCQNGNQEFNSFLISKVLLAAEPTVCELSQLISRGNVPNHIKVNFERGLRRFVLTRLVFKERLLGCWMIFLDSTEEVGKEKLNLIGHLSGQISMAIAHISTSMEMLNKEDEKARLLEFSNALISVRDKNQLSQILLVKLKEFFGIDDYIVHALSEDKKSFTPLLFVREAVFTDQPEFIKQLDADNDVYDGVFDITLASKGPVIHNMEEIALRKNAPAYITAATAVKLRRMVGVTLRVGEESIAILNFRLEDANQIDLNGNLFKSICAQLAIVVENIIANEKVIKQLAEIDRYKQQLEEERIYLTEEILTNQFHGEIVGDSKQMQDTFRLVTQVASSDSTVLILGETGTGKELIARAIHNNSPRKDKLLVKVNCAALPANLIESELFGHERGSFTGATDRRIGKFELADKGTLFLDEIGEMPPELQVKLLRALQEKEIERIGGRNVIKVDVRIIAATNRDLEKEMEEGRFRSDLYYRLNVFPILLAPLRERPQDIPLLAAHFMSRYSKKTAKNINKLSSKALQELSRYSWPGNIRELEHLMERSVLLSHGDVIRHIDLPADKTNFLSQTGGGSVVIRTIDENEREHILRVLKHCNGRVAGEAGAAQLLGVPASTLNSKIKKLGIRREHHA